MSVKNIKHYTYLIYLVFISLVLKNIEKNKKKTIKIKNKLSRLILNRKKPHSPSIILILEKYLLNNLDDRILIY
jgi:IS4 transposase